jgi:hypothetical protein
MTLKFLAWKGAPYIYDISKLKVKLFAGITLIRNVSLRHRGWIQNIPDWCRFLYSSCGSAKHRSKQAKLWIPCFTAKFYCDCVKTCEDVAPNFGDNRLGCFTMTTLRLTLPSSHSSFWRNMKMAVIPHPPYSSDLAPCDLFRFPKMKLWRWKDAGLIPLRRSKLSRRECLTLREKRTSSKCSKNGGDSGTGVYMREGTTSRLMVIDRPCGEF